jgi:hypothetical protein
VRRDAAGVDDRSADHLRLPGPGADRDLRALPPTVSFEGDRSDRRRDRSASASVAFRAVLWHIVFVSQSQLTVDNLCRRYYSCQLELIVVNWKRKYPMRPPKTQRSTLRYPLDALLGSPALVRLTRVLTYEVRGPVGVTDAARMGGLSTAGARKALEHLEQAGIATRVGTGRAQKYGLRDASPYIEPLRQLFEQEQQQYDDLIQRLRQALEMPEVREAWVERLPMEPGEALQVDIIADAKAVPWLGPELRTRVVETEKLFNLIIELPVFTRADAPVIPQGAILLWGAGHATRADRGPGAQTHEESAERSLRMAEAIADLITADPSLIQRARQQTNRLLHEGQGTANSDIGEWRQLLETYSAERLRDLLVSRSSRADRLRRSSPFFAVLTPEERDRMMRELEAKR